MSDARCTKCGDIKNLNDFYVRENGKIRKDCKICVKERLNEYRKNNYLKIMDQEKKFRKFHPLYFVWQGIMARCTNPNNPAFKRYGGRGIKVCNDWAKYENFEKDMFSTYQKGLQIERINNNGNYCPENCRWATPQEQSNNRRDNHLISYKGISMTIPRWADKIGIKRSTLGMRIYKYGWSVEKALTFNKQ